MAQQPDYSFKILLVGESGVGMRERERDVGDHLPDDFFPYPLFFDIQ